ncbi:MAG: AGE family epimerase/isomerase [Planctomycetes bacterium]|nr:AGE family epimerase/isomerase [Planctomycetota bacterium]
MRRPIVSPGPLSQALLALVACIGFLSSPCSANDAQLADDYIPRLETMLMDNIGSFWLDKAIDQTYGGYLIDFDAQGVPGSGSTKMIVTQARTVWLFSQMVRTGFGGAAHLAGAEHGYRFLRDKMWDREHGGFYWQVDRTGDRKLQPLKHLYGQAFGLYALSEYYLAGHDPNALALATELFDLLERKAHDKRHGGYVEFFQRDWSAPPDTATGYLGVPASMKLMNTHLHLLEALTTYYEASRSTLALERLGELILVESDTMIVKPIGAATDKYDLDWTRRLDSGYAVVSYGHDIENVWLLMKACEVAGLSNSILNGFYQYAYDNSYRYGYDATHGGYYDAGPLGQPANSLNKTWWVQAEALVSALYMYRLTGSTRYLSVFETTYDFVDKHLADWEHGEWHSRVAADGSGPSGAKGQDWKCGYHNGRAMIECIGVLRALKAKAEQAAPQRRRQ